MHLRHSFILFFMFSLTVWVGVSFRTQAQLSETRSVMVGDRLRIEVQEQRDLNRVYPVVGDGTIDLGKLGRVSVADMTLREAAQRIKRHLEEQYFKQATVDVEIEQYVEGSILVMGEVNNPREIEFSEGRIITLMEAISLSGGLSSRAAGSAVRILRWNLDGGMAREVLTVDVQSMFDSLDFSNDQFLRPRDIVLVPRLGEGEGGGEFLALGAVNAPGFHPYTEGMDVIRAISKVGGVSKDAVWSSARILRQQSPGNYIPIPIDLSQLFGAADMRLNVPVEAGDILFVPSAQHSNRGRVYLLGEVENKGAISLPLGVDATLAKVILRNGGLTKFANPAKIKVLRTSPDGAKQTLVCDVGNILDTGSFEDDIPLQDGDVVIVPGKILGF